MKFIFVVLLLFNLFLAQGCKCWNNNTIATRNKKCVVVILQIVMLKLVENSGIFGIVVINIDLFQTLEKVKIKCIQ
jgi:hypothetical protein